MISSFPTPPRDSEEPRRFAREISAAVRGLLLGNSNNVLDVTLNANATSTTVTDDRIGFTTVALCVPTSASAAAIGTPYRDFSAPVAGSMVLIHASDANTDKTFKVVLIG